MNKKNEINGFFTAFNNSAIEPEAIENGASLKNGRCGIFYRKKELIKTLHEKPFSKKNVLIVTAKITIENIKKYNEIKFNFLPNSNAKILKVQTFDEAFKEVKI